MHPTKSCGIDRSDNSLHRILSSDHAFGDDSIEAASVFVPLIFGSIRSKGYVNSSDIRPLKRSVFPG